MGKKSTKPQPSDADRLSAFVRRLRRIEAHPLIAADGGALIRHLHTTPFRVLALQKPDGTPVGTQLKFDLPDEVVFESLAARLRPMTLANDVLGHAAVMDSLDALTAHVDDPRIAKVNAQARADWAAATERDRARGGKVRAYKMVVGTRGGDDAVTLTDLDLAYAWLYEDSLHGDLPSTDMVSSRDRYFAAVTVFCHIAVVALKTLGYLRWMIENGHLILPDAALNAEVVVVEPAWTENVAAHMAGPEVNPDEFEDPDSIPDGALSIHDFIHENYGRAGDDESVVEAGFEATVHIGEAESTSPETAEHTNDFIDELTAGD
ncbi:hypothetical protein GCM10009855_13860 [Gordonia cholesterolivorans]|uniref:Uncharacterized protein n=1 Tax=Gordonia cholesterolivorans TaxID=559625 RepID=A0ABN3HC86_9ACTN